MESLSRFVRETLILTGLGRPISVDSHFTLHYRRGLWPT
jgi:hypothetical protein